MPDDYLEQLESLGTETTTTAAELCTLGTWERADGGYRVLDWEGAGYVLEGVCQRRNGEDPQALAEERDHETKAWALLARPVIITPRCAICGIDSARVETVAPGQMPARWDKLPGIIQDGIRQARRPGMWHLIAIGPAAGSLYGVPIDAARAGQIAWALRPPLRFAQVHQAGLHDDAGICPHCDAAYCYYHWTPSTPDTAGAPAATARASTQTGNRPATVCFSSDPDGAVMPLKWLVHDRHRICGIRHFRIDASSGVETIGRQDMRTVIVRSADNARGAA